MERERRTKSGNLLEIDFFPIWDNGNKISTRPKGIKPSSEAQKKYNNAMAIKRCIRLINANFDSGDLLITYTYIQAYAPATLDDATRDINNYIRRIKTKRASELKKITRLLKEEPNNPKLTQKFKKLTAPFKYYYTIEEVAYKTGEKRGMKNYHVHLFMTGGIERDDAERIWGKGLRVNAMRFQPENFGPEAAARYIAKDPQGKRRFRHSKNLTQPKTVKKDGRITRRGVELLAKLRVDDRDYWERRYKGYRFLRCFTRFNQYNGHWYVSAIMYKADAKDLLPDWKVGEEEWMSEF